MNNKPELLIYMDNDFNVSIQLVSDDNQTEENMTLGSYSEIDTLMAKLEKKHETEAQIFMCGTVNK